MSCGRGYHQDEDETVTEETARVHDSGSHGIPRYRIHELCRELAAGEVKRAELARKYGVSRTAITKFAQRHKGRIAEIKAHLDDEYAGLWIAQKQNRIAALMADYEATLEHYRGDHHEWVKARTAIAHAVAEELGQLPNKSNLTIGGTVRHELVGVDVNECFPADEPGETEKS